MTAIKYVDYLKTKNCGRHLSFEAPTESN